MYYHRNILLSLIHSWSSTFSCYYLLPLASRLLPFEMKYVMWLQSHERQRHQSVWSQLTISAILGCGVMARKATPLNVQPVDNTGLYFHVSS